MALSLGGADGVARLNRHAEFDTESLREPDCAILARMTDNVTNELLLETLRAIRTDIGALRDQLVEVKADIRGVKSNTAEIFQYKFRLKTRISHVDRLDK